jgi:hypothetical protein
MKYNMFKIAVCSIIILLVAGCKEPYVLPAKAVANTNFLVVEGNINVGQDSTIIKLSHTKPLNDSTLTIPETGAQITVQTDAGGSYPLQELGNGAYAVAYIPAGGGSEKYRLSITTATNNQYFSDYVEFKKAPAIDSVSWEQLSDGVHVYINTHDAENKTKYYKWDYVEVWEYHAPFASAYSVENGQIVPRSPDSLIYKCWQTATSSDIIIQSTGKLSNDVVYKKQVNFIPQSDERIGVTYSILVKQSALTEAGFNYWNTLSKNTEQLGSLFDALPSLLTGNIHSKTNAAEPVIGFITTTTSEQKRIFITKLQLNNWLYPPAPYSICDTIHATDADRYAKVLNGSYIPIDLLSPIGPYYAAPLDCADCRVKGGVTTKPSFWP